MQGSLYGTAPLLTSIYEICRPVHVTHCWVAFFNGEMFTISKNNSAQPEQQYRFNEKIDKTNALWATSSANHLSPCVSISREIPEIQAYVLRSSSQESEDSASLAWGSSWSTVGIPLSCRARRNTGNWRWPGSVRDAHTKQLGFCGCLRNVPAPTLLKTLWCAMAFSLLPVTNTRGGCRHLCEHTHSQRYCSHTY